MALLSLDDVQELNEQGVVQCDIHRRSLNEQRAGEQINARNKLLYRFLPFVWLEDQNLPPIDLMETVGNRLLDAARRERENLKGIFIAAE